MHRTILPALAVWLAVAGAAEARAKPPQPIWESVAAHLDEEVNFADRESDLPDRAPVVMTTPTQKMFTALDINGDGVVDWRVDYEQAPNPSFFCGTGGCRQELWVSEPGGGHRRVMSVGARLFKISRRGGTTRLDLDFHGSLCDGAGVQPCPRSYIWDERDGFVETATPDSRTWLTGGPHTLEPPDFDSVASPALLAALERIQTQCQENLGFFVPENARRLPDLDGDGVRDWVVGGTYAACEYAMEDSANTSPPLPILFVVSAGGREGKLALEMPAGSRFGVDIKGAPATLYVAEPETACEFEKPCGKALRWDPATGFLTE